MTWRSKKYMSSKCYILFDTIWEAFIPKIGRIFIINFETSRGSGAKLYIHMIRFPLKRTGPRDRIKRFLSKIQKIVLMSCHLCHFQRGSAAKYRRNYIILEFAAKLLCGTPGFLLLPWMNSWFLLVHCSSSYMHF